MSKSAIIRMTARWTCCLTQDLGLFATCAEGCISDFCTSGGKRKEKAKGCCPSVRVGSAICVDQPDLASLGRDADQLACSPLINSGHLGLVGAKFSSSSSQSPPLNAIATSPQGNSSRPRQPIQRCKAWPATATARASQGSSPYARRKTSLA